MTRIKGSACFFLVTLRLVIGWHFFIEGAYKIHTHRVGKTATNTPWTSEGFFREGYGPAARWSRDMLDIGDMKAISRFAISENKLSRELADDWDSYFERFVAHYQLTDEQRTIVIDAFETHRARLNDWLKGSTTTDVKVNVAWGQVELKLTLPQRIAAIQAKQRQIDEIIDTQSAAFNSEVEKTKLRVLKTDVARLFADLNNEYDLRLGAVRTAIASILMEEQVKLGPIPESPASKRIHLVDRIVMWTQLVLGICLMLGLFTTVSSLILAAFLIHVTLVAPALSYAPTPPGAVGHYLYINLYTIELVALLALAVIPTGRWFGLDTLWLSFRHRQPPPVEDFSLSGRLLKIRTNR